MHAVLAAAALLLAVVNVYVVQSVDAFGSPLLFAISLLAELVFITGVIYNLVLSLRVPLKVIGSILLSAEKGALTNPYIKRLRKSKSPVYRWVINRLNYRKPTGLLLSAGALVTLIFLIGFSSILQDVWFHEPLTRIDTRVINLVQSIRTPLQTNFFRFVTFTANPESIIFIVLLAGILLWRKGQKLALFILLLATFTQFGSAYVLKNLVGRMRPERALSLYSESSYSFPSGHVLATTVVFGYLAYLSFRSFKSHTLKLLVVLGYLLSVALVSLSRIYLGVHYPSDVLASILFGAAILAACITSAEVMIRFNIRGQGSHSFANRQLVFIPIVVVIMSLIFSPILIKLNTVSTVKTFQTLPGIDNTTVQKLPLYSETLTGKPMEPVSGIYVGSEQQIRLLFVSHGWYVADPSTVSNTLRALSVGFQGHQYVNAPVTPSYLSATPETIAFQKPTALNTLRQRHHTRLWQTDFKLPDGREVWVATASYDESIEFAGKAKLPTHHIDPDIDAERSFILSSLNLTSVDYVQAVHAEAGKNNSGDIFFTDGRAFVVNL